jgi:hypothetical protein
MTSLDQLSPAIDHQIGENGNLAIRVASAEIRLTGVDGDRVVVRTTNGRPLPDRVIVETNERGLTLRERDHVGFLADRGSIDLEIDVPRGAAISIDTASGNIEAEGLAGEQRYRTASGDLQVRDAAGTLELTSVSGDSEVFLVGPTDLMIRSVSGDVAVSGGSLRSLRVGTTSGDIRVDSPILARKGTQIDTLSGDVGLIADAAAGMRIEAKTVSGDLTSELPHRSEGRMGRRTLVIGDGSVEVAFRSVSGDLLVHEARPGAGAADLPPAPVAPAPPAPPAAPAPDAPETASEAFDDDDPVEAARLRILKALEAGELDVATAMNELADLDAPAPAGGEGADA